MNARFALFAATVAGCSLFYNGASAVRADDDDDDRRRSKATSYVDGYRYSYPGKSYRGSKSNRYRTYRPNYSYSPPRSSRHYTNYPRYASDTAIHNDNWRYVSNLYRDILLREGSPQEIDGWLRAMELEGASRSDVKREFLASDEFRRLDRNGGRIGPRLDPQFDF